jgi:hypothetical protein
VRPLRQAYARRHEHRPQGTAEPTALLLQRRQREWALRPARASARSTVIEPYVEEQLIAAFAGEGPFADALVRQEQLDDALRELAAARHVLAQYVSNTTLIETIGV